MLLCSLLFAMFGWSMIFRHQKENLQATRFTKMDDYILARWNLDTELSELEWQMYHLDASVKGTILLVFDQCAPNAYDIVYPQLAEFGMVGSVTFRDTLPGDAGAMTREQWLELESKFRPHIKTEGIPFIEEGRRWQYQMHIYESPFYYIDYCLAQTAAFGFLLASLEDYDAAFARYVHLSKQGGETYFEDLLKEAEIPSPFQEGALQTLADKIESLLLKLKADI
jgi:hypothetical protein